MYEYLKGVLTEATPTYVVVECAGVGYFVNTTVNTYSKIVNEKNVQLFIHLIVREDAHILYGFYSLEERTIFRQLISVSGIGANTAGVMLSSMTTDEIVNAIQTENVNAIKSVKGIGLKTAQRVIIELKDKVNNIVTTGVGVSISLPAKEEALSALVMLGFAKVQASKVLDNIVAANPAIGVEELIKLALKQM
ncbi:MAG: Holliday junction branch migration protein RuvA [Odoribacter sp.]|nr:Holliday junction branch migration protein RuvA [Odoribacter sp.]